MVTCSEIVFNEEKHIISMYTNKHYNKNVYYTYLQTKNEERR